MSNLVSLFPGVFPDSEIAKKITLGRTKFSYLLCFGVAPFLRVKLIEQLKDAPEYVALFDESLNSVSQRSQMDILVRFWDESKHQVVTKYFNSVYLSRTKASDLVHAFCEAFDEIGLRKLTSISMDGPNVNWSFFTQIGQLRQVEELPGLLSLGSCGLHVVHGAASLGHKMSEWKLQELFSSAYYLFKDSPMRRAQFTELTGCSSFPLKFCRTRWCENSAVAKRFLEIVPSLKKYCSSVAPKPTIISFGRTERHLQDPLLTAKLSFFISVCQNVEPFLQTFQSPKPMIPFLFDSLANLQTTLARRYLKSSFVDSATSPTKLVTAIENANDDDFLPIPELGIAAGLELDKLKRSSNTAYPRLVLSFRHQCRTYLHTMTKKLVQRSPLKYDAVKQVRALNPSFMIEKPDAAKSLMAKLIKSLCEKGLLLDVHMGDLIKQEFTSLLEDREFAKTVHSFREAEDRLDDFYYCLCGTSLTYKHLWEVIRKVLTLSHGNASVESGFSIQRNQIVENLSEETMVAKRRVYDAVKDEPIEEMISDQMIKATHGSNARYNAALEEKKRNATSKEIQEESIKKRKMKALNVVREEERRAEAALEAVRKKRKEIDNGKF